MYMYEYKRVSYTYSKMPLYVCMSKSLFLNMREYIYLFPPLASLLSHTHTYSPPPLFSLSHTFSSSISLQVSQNFGSIFGICVNTYFFFLSRLLSHTHNHTLFFPLAQHSLSFSVSLQVSQKFSDGVLWQPSCNPE